MYEKSSESKLGWQVRVYGAQQDGKGHLPIFFLAICFCGENHKLVTDIPSAAQNGRFALPIICADNKANRN